MFTNDNIINFVTDLALAMIEAQDALNAGKMPDEFGGFIEGIYIRFNDEEKAENLLDLEYIIEDFTLQKEDLIENRLIYNEWELIRKIVDENIRSLIDLCRSPDEYIIKICFENDFYNLVYYYGEAQGYDYAMKPLRALWKSADENDVMFEWGYGTIDVYESES